MTEPNFSNIAIICPTKSQPEKVRRLLDCVKNLADKPGQVIIADADHNLAEIVRPFESNFNVHCVYCPRPGQVLQRSFAQSKLEDSIQIVVHIDDDITFGPEFLQKILENWIREVNISGKILAGMSFNIIDLPKYKPSFLHNLFFLNTDCPGSVSKAGYAAPFAPADLDLHVEWLLGGATAWSRDVLTSHAHPIDFSTRWAVCEDLIYSYPLRKHYKLFVASDVECFHNETYSQIGLKAGIFYGKTSVVMRYFFVTENSELSFLAFSWMTVGIISSNLLKTFCFSTKNMGLFLGGIFGFSLVIYDFIFSRDARALAKSLY